MMPTNYGHEQSNYRPRGGEVHFDEPKTRGAMYRRRLGLTALVLTTALAIKPTYAYLSAHTTERMMEGRISLLESAKKIVPDSLIAARDAASKTKQEFDKNLQYLAMGAGLLTLGTLAYRRS